MSEITVQYQGGLRCQAQHIESGAVVQTDAPKDNHGMGEGFSPSEMLSVSLGSCILSIMGIAAQSMDIDIPGATAIIDKTMGNNPRKIVRLAVHVHVPQDLNQRQKTKLEAAAHACPVHSILSIDAPITFTWGTPGSV